MSSPQTVPVVVVYDYLLDMSGAPIPNARVQCVLDENAATTISPATSIIEKQQIATTDANGYFSFSLIPNTNISPANTTYTIITPARTYQITVGASGPYQTTANGTIVDVPVALNPATTGLTGPITITGNLTVTGNETVSGTLTAGTLALGATTVTTLHATGAATLDSGVTVTTGGATITAGNLAVTAGELTMGAAASKIVPGATSLSVRDHADANDNLLVANAGALTVRNGLTVTAGNAALTAGNLTFGAAAARIIPGATSLALRNNADNANNLLISDAGAATVRAGLTVTAGTTTTNGDLVLATAPRIKTTGTIPTIGSSGAGVSAVSVVTGSTNTAGQVNATLTGTAPGVVIGVVAFGGAPLATAPIAVVASLSAPTAGVAAPPVIGADTFTTSGFTLRSYGPTTVTTAAYVISYVVIF